jgi:hypothetical protein
MIELLDRIYFLFWTMAKFETKKMTFYIVVESSSRNPVVVANESLYIAKKDAIEQLHTLNTHIAHKPSVTNNLDCLRVLGYRKASFDEPRVPLWLNIRLFEEVGDLELVEIFLSIHFSSAVAIFHGKEGIENALLHHAKEHSLLDMLEDEVEEELSNPQPY